MILNIEGTRYDARDIVRYESDPQNFTSIIFKSLNSPVIIACKTKECASAVINIIDNMFCSEAKFTSIFVDNIIEQSKKSENDF